MQEARTAVLNGPDRRLRYAFVTAVVLTCDQLTKLAVTRSLGVGESIPVIDGAFYITHVRNSGAAFGLLRGMSGVLALAALVGIVVFVAVIVKHPPPLVGWGAGLIVGGALGNLADRVFRPWPLDGTVVDFFDLVVWPTFNVADAAITVGAAILVFAGFLDHGDGDEARQTGADAPDEVHDRDG